MIFLQALLLSVCIGTSVAVDPLVKLDYTSYRGVALQNGITQWLGVRYAAPPLGDLRFAAPQDPPKNNSVQAANTPGKLCLATGANPKSNTTSEDCLFLNLFAPSNANSSSNLPVYFFIQGGGFNSNSNPNYNGSGLIQAADMDMVVVMLNYRVGPWGFLAGSEVQQGGSLNNGLKDQIKALQWVQKHIKQFGGNPNHVVIGGASAGAASVTMLLTAYGGRDDHLFVGAASESQSFATQWTSEQSQWMYDNLVIRTQCVSANESLACLRGLSAEEIQAVNINTPLPGSQNPPLYMYSPTLDDDLVPDFTYTLFKEGKFIHVPTIFGDDTNGGSAFTPRNTSNFSQSDTFLRDQFPALTLTHLAKIHEYYPKTNDSFPNSGPYFRQASNAYGDLRYMCPGLYCSDAYTNISSFKSWNYRYNVEDPPAMASGLGVIHTVEVTAIFGPENVNGGAPASYSTTNAAIVPEIQGYWTSFVRALDPNTYRAEGSPRWEEWNSTTWNRLMMQTNQTRMETVGAAEKERCVYLSSIGPSVLQ